MLCKMLLAGVSNFNITAAAAAAAVSLSCACLFLHLMTWYHDTGTNMSGISPRFHHKALYVALYECFKHFHT